LRPELLLLLLQVRPPLGTHTWRAFLCAKTAAVLHFCDHRIGNQWWSKYTSRCAPRCRLLRTIANLRADSEARGRETVDWTSKLEVHAERRHGGAASAHVSSHSVLTQAMEASLSSRVEALNSRIDIVVANKVCMLNACEICAFAFLRSYP
jgi:hypothetical protein